MRCQRCNAEINSGEEFRYKDEILCEDCYLDVIAKPQACDPWAVYQAKQTSTQDAELTETQRSIYELLKASAPLSEEQICSQLGISKDEFATNFAILRHMELTKACKVQGEKRFTIFGYEPQEN